MNWDEGIKKLREITTKRADAALRRAELRQVASLASQETAEQIVKELQPLTELERLYRLRQDSLMDEGTVDVRIENRGGERRVNVIAFGYGVANFDCLADYDEDGVTGKCIVVDCATKDDVSMADIKATVMSAILALVGEEKS